MGVGPFRDGWVEADVEAVIARGDPGEVGYAPIVASLDPPDCDWALSVCVRLSSHPDLRVRSNALLGFAHLSRTCGRLDEAVVRPLVEAALANPELAGRASDVADDLGTYLGWEFSRARRAPPGAATAQPLEQDRAAEQGR